MAIFKFWRFFASCIFSRYQSATAEIKRGKKEERRKKKEEEEEEEEEPGKNIMVCPVP